MRNVALAAAQGTTQTHMRSNMRTNVKTILSAIGVAALVASPVMAKTARPHHATSSSVYIPNNARASVAPYGVNEGGPYTPSMPAPAHGLNPDFQGGNPN